MKKGLKRSQSVEFTCALYKDITAFALLFRQAPLVYLINHKNVQLKDLHLRFIEIDSITIITSKQYIHHKNKNTITFHATTAM